MGSLELWDGAKSGDCKLVEWHEGKLVMSGTRRV